MGLNGPPIRLLDDVLRLTYIHNAGAAFGLFHGNRWFFIGVTVLSALVLLYLAGSGRYRDPWLSAAFGMIFGGALGNLIDRIWLGVVIDYVQMGIAGHFWPVYNIADIGVTVGVAVLLARLLFERTESEGEAVSPTPGREDET